MNEVLDRAREWVNENYPDADEDEWEALVADAAEEIAAIDDANDLAGI